MYIYMYIYIYIFKCNKHQYYSMGYYRSVDTCRDSLAEIRCALNRTAPMLCLSWAIVADGGPTLKGLAQAKIIKKSVILLNMYID